MPPSTRPTGPTTRPGIAQPQPEALPAGAISRLGIGRLYHHEADESALSPDGSTLVSVGKRDVRFWDTRTGLRKGIVPLGEKPLAASYAGQVTLITPTRIWVIDPARSRVVRKTKLPVKASDARLTLDGRWAALLEQTGATGATPSTSPDRRTLAIVETGTGKSRRFPIKHQAYVATHMAFSPDGKRLAMALVNKVVKVLEVPSGRQVARFEVTGLTDKHMLWGVALGKADGPLWLRVGYDGLEQQKHSHVLEWSSLIKGAQPRVAGDLDPERGLVSDGEYLYAKRRGASCLHVRNLKTGKIRCLPAAGYAWPESARNGVLAAAGQHRRRLFDRGGRERALPTAGHRGSIRYILAIGKGENETLLTLGGDRYLRRWRRSGRLLAEDRLPAELDRMAASEDGRVVLVWSEKKAYVVTPTGATTELAHGRGRIQSAAVSPDGELLTVAGAEKLVMLSAEGELKASLKLPLSICWDMLICELIARFSPDGKVLAVSTYAQPPKGPAHTGQVVLFDMETKKELRRLTIPSLDPNPAYKGDRTTFVHQMSFTPDGKGLVVVCYGDAALSRSRALLFDPGSGRRLGEWDLPLGDAQHLAVGADEIAVAGSAGLIALRPGDGKTLRCRRPTGVKELTYRAVALDGGAVFASPSEGGVTLWFSEPCRLTAGAPRTAASSVRLGTCPTFPEQARYPAPRWTSAVKLKRRAEIPGLLKQPFKKDERVVFCKWEHGNCGPEKTPTTCRELLALIDKGWIYTGRSRFEGATAEVHSLRCRTLALLGEAKPARRSFLRGFSLDKKPLKQLPPLAVLSESEAKRLRKRPVAWERANEAIKVGAACPTRLVALDPHSDVTVDLLAMGDFNGDGLEDVLLEVSLNLSRGAGHHSSTHLQLLTRRRRGAVLQPLKEW